MNIHVEIVESSSGKLLVKKPIKDITVMGFLCEFDVNESQALMDDQGRYKSFDARIIPTVASPEHHLPAACDLHSVRRISAISSVVSFRYKSPIREVQQALDELSNAAELALREKSMREVVKRSGRGKNRALGKPEMSTVARRVASNY